MKTSSLTRRILKLLIEWPIYMSHPNREYLNSKEYEHDKYLADKTRELINRETNLKSNRITWMLTSQSLLFVAFGNLYGKNALFPCFIISILGASTTLSYVRPIWICDRAILKFRSYYTNHLKSPSDWHPSVDFIAESEEEKQYENLEKLLPTESLPWLFFCGWSSLFFMISTQFIPSIFMLEHI